MTQHYLHMAILSPEQIGSIPSTNVIQMAGTLPIVTVLICYFLAVSLGHVPAFFPMISDLDTNPPEYYVFRIGFLFSSLLLLFCEWQLKCLYANVFREFDKTRAVAYAVSCVSALFLALLTSISEDEFYDLHLFCAFAFFVLVFAYFVMMLYVESGGAKDDSECKPMSKFKIENYELRLGVVIFEVLAFIAFAVFRIINYYPGFAICEWLAVLAVIVWHSSFYTTFRNNHIYLVLSELTDLE